MILLWTKSANIVDYIIWLFTGEDCQHFAIKMGDLIYEANLVGCHSVDFKSWMKKDRTIIHQIAIDVTAEELTLIKVRWADVFGGHPYDFGGALYLGLCKLRERLWQTALPKKNKWATRSAFFCDECFQLPNMIAKMPKIDYDQNGMMSPHDVFLAFKAYFRAHGVAQ